MVSTNSITDRVDDQILWYDKKSIVNQRWHKTIKTAEILAAALIPFAAGLGASATLTGGLGVCIVVLEGLQGLNQYQQNWINYRSTCEQLKHEKYLFLAKAGPFLKVENPEALFAERAEALISREHAKWVSGREQYSKDQGNSSD